MALNTSKCNSLTAMHFKGLTVHYYNCGAVEWKSLIIAAVIIGVLLTAVLVAIIVYSRASQGWSV